MKFTDEDIIQISKNLSNIIYENNVSATRELVGLINKLPHLISINEWSDVVEIYDNSFYTYTTWEDLVASEKEQGVYGLTEDELRNEMNKSIWQLPCGWYVQRV
jgi:hypothetical protein